MPAMAVWAVGAGGWAALSERWELTLTVGLAAVLAAGMSSILDRLEARP